MELKNGNWVVKIESTHHKQLVVENCTEDQARSCPWEYAVDETYLGMVDWEILSVKPKEDDYGN